MQIIESDIVELGSANILRKQGIQNKQQLSLRVQQSDDMAVTEPCGPALNAAEPLFRGHHRKQSIVRVGGVSDNIPSSGHAALGGNVLNGGGRSPIDLLRCPHHSTYIPPVRGFAASTPHEDAAGQDALYGAAAECSEDGRRQEGSPHPSQEVQILCLLNQCRSVHRAGEVVCDVHPQELGAADHLHSCAVDNVIFGFLLHLLPVSLVVVVPDEAHPCCVVCKLHNVVGGCPWDAVVSHQSEQQGA